MAKIKISDEEYALRKEVGLPVTKALRYMEHTMTGEYEEIPVIAWSIADQYFPSGMHSLSVTLQGGEVIRILAPFFVHMQKPSFVNDMRKAASGEEMEE